MRKPTIAGADSTARPSWTIWGDCPIEDMLTDLGTGYFFRDDFLNFGVGATDKLASWLYYVDTGNTVTQLATEVGGVVQLLTDATDNDAPVLISGGNTAGMVKVVSGGKSMWFEARVRVGATITEQACFVGLAEEGVAVNDGIIIDNPDTAITGVMADKDYIGFANFTNAAPVWTPSYNKASGADQVGTTTSAIAASTWKKLGLKFDADADTLTWYVDGSAVRSIDVSDAGTTNFPSGEELAIVLAFKNGSAGARSLDCDWVQIAQLR